MKTTTTVVLGIDVLPGVSAIYYQRQSASNLTTYG